MGMNVGGYTGGSYFGSGGSSNSYINEQLQNQYIVKPQLASQEKVAQIGADASKFPAQMQQDRFNQVFPWLQGQLGSLQSQMATAGGQSPKSPEITVGGVYNPQQIQQQVNATRAQGDQAMNSTIRQNTQQNAGKGFGSNSPLLQALNGQARASNLGTNTMAEQQFRNQAAQANAGHVLQTQQAREGQFASRQNEDIERRKPYWSTMNSLIGALGGLV